MAAVTQTIPHFLGGVSNQPDDKKLPGQVKEAINAYPDPTFGLQKRPGLKYITELKDGIPTGGTAFNDNDLDNAKWFYINRDADEKYIGCIAGNATAANANIHVWNTVVDGGAYKKAAVTLQGTEFTVKTDGTGSGTNGTYTNKAIASTTGSGSSMTVNVTIAGNVCTAITVHTEGTGYKVGDEITIAKANCGNTTADVVGTITAVNSREYLNALNSYDYDILNVRDDTIITNKTKPAKIVAGDAYNLSRKATVLVTLVEYSAKYQVDIKIGDTTYTSTYDTKAGDTASNDNDTTNFLDADDILDALRTKILAGGDGSQSAGIPTSCIKIGTSLEIEHSADFTIIAKGGRTGGNSLKVYQDEVQNVTELSGETTHERIVKIVNTFSSAGSYYTKFKANNKVSGPGIWLETFEPGGEKGLNSATMPHRLVNTDKNAFTFEVIEDDHTNNPGVFGTPRLVGDNETNEHPSCVVRLPDGTISEKTIQQCFYYNNRLGFLTEDNVSMSQAGDYYNLYAASAQTSIASDPIDLSCSSIKEATLHGIIPTAAGLILFSQNQQFIMYSADGNLSPQTALIRGLSNYQMDEKIDPVDVGTNINFVSKTHTTAGFTRVFGMLPQGVGQIPKVIDIGRVVSEYIPADITALTASPQNSFIAMYGPAKDKVYFYRTYSDGEEDLIQCWFSWQFPGNPHFIEVDSDTLFSVIKTGTGSSARYHLVSATLTQTPEETIIVTADGQQVNPHMDFYAKASSVAWDSDNERSKCYLPFDDISTLDPVIIIAGTQTWSGVTESGFTLEPSRGSDGTGDFFSIPNKDLSGSEATNVYVGYKYKYDVTLPKMYFRRDADGRVTDYTASLIVARMKFSIAQSSVVGFKLKSKGIQAATQSFTGDGSTTAFSPTFDVADKNDVIVKKNGAIQTKGTDYTIADHTSLTGKVTVTFSSAPLAERTEANKLKDADTVEIYLDNWFTLQPTQEANYYLSDDVPLDTQSTFVVPIHQRTDNYTLRVYSDSPFPVSLTSMMWEGTYSPRYYRRT